jgi:hypothetical protein
LFVFGMHTRLTPGSIAEHAPELRRFNAVRMGAWTEIDKKGKGIRFA